jgi:hypothetical protein
VKKRLGEILMERGMIDVDQLNSALAHQRQWGVRLGTALVAKGFIAEGVLTRVLSESLGIPMVDLSRVQPEQKALALLGGRLCEQYDVFPLALQEQKGRKTLLLAMADPLNATIIDELAFTHGCIVKPAIAQISSLDQAIRRYYHAQRVEISPLSFEKGGLTSTGRLDTQHPRIAAGEESESMTIITAGGKEELVVGGRAADAPIVNLTEEVVGFPGPPRTDPHGGQQPTTGEMLAGVRAADLEQLEAMEKKFWALMRVLARKGLISKDEFLSELRGVEEA